MSWAENKTELLNVLSILTRLQISTCTQNVIYQKASDTNTLTYVPTKSPRSYGLLIMRYLLLEY